MEERKDADEIRCGISHPSSGCAWVPDALPSMLRARNSMSTELPASEIDVESGSGVMPSHSSTAAASHSADTMPIPSRVPVEKYQQAAAGIIIAGVCRGGVHCCWDAASVSSYHVVLV